MCMALRAGHPRHFQQKQGNSTGPSLCLPATWQGLQALGAALSHTHPPVCLGGSSPQMPWCVEEEARQALSLAAQLREGGHLGEGYQEPQRCHQVSWSCSGKALGREDNGWSGPEQALQRLSTPHHRWDERMDGPTARPCPGLCPSPSQASSRPAEDQGVERVPQRVRVPGKGPLRHHLPRAAGQASLAFPTHPVLQPHVPAVAWAEGQKGPCLLGVREGRLTCCWL